jgi:hypothetical protein
MVKSKHRSAIGQYMKHKTNKWGLILWVYADSGTGYTVEFNVYSDEFKYTSQYGLSYDVVMESMNPCLNQGYHLYLDHFLYFPSTFAKCLFEGYSFCGHGEN